MSKGGVTEFDDFDGFAGHEPSKRRGTFLSKWKEDKSITVWMHTKRPPLAIWRHPIPTIVDITKDEKTTRRVFPKSYTCPEYEELLAKQYFRDEHGERQDPPRKCGVCKLIDWFYEQCLLFDSTKGKKGICWTDKVFHFEADDSKETKTLRAGGICGLFNERDMEDERLEQLKRAKINLREDWAQNMHAKMQYAFCVVNNDDVDAGVQIATESKALGDAVKTVIRKTKKAKGAEAGSYALNPYPIEWEFDKTKQFSAMYDATRLEDVEITSKIRKLIVTDPPPDLSEITKPLNQKIVRLALEEACLIKGVPWDELFTPSKEDDDEEEEKPAKRSAKAEPESERRPAAKAKKDPEPEDALVECDECGKPMKLSASKCPHCGAKYDVAAEEPAPPPPPPMRKRSEKAATKPATRKDLESSRNVGGDDPDDDSMPF